MQLDKLIKKVKRNPGDVKYEELIKVMEHYGFYCPNPKKSGSHKAYAHKLLTPENLKCFPGNPQLHIITIPYGGRKTISFTVVKKVLKAIEIIETIETIKEL